MNSKEAYTMLIEKHPHIDISSCMEYRSHFVFYIGSTNKRLVMSRAVSVNKQTGEIKVFNPLDGTIPSKEFKFGIKVTDFK